MKRWLPALIALLALAGLITWRLRQKSAADAAQAETTKKRLTAAPMVSLATAATGDIIHTFAGVGSVESPFNVKLAPKITGRVEYLEVREGAKVARGQVLARIDPSEVNAQVRQAQSAVAEAEARLAQAQFAQNPINVGVTSQIETQRAGVTSSRADLNQTSQNYAAQVAASQSAVVDAQGRVDAASAAVENARASIRNAQANLENAQTRLARTLDIYRQGFIAAQDVDDARSAVKVQQGALDIAQGLLNSAQSQRGSALAQKNSAEQQSSIVANKGKADIAASQAKLDQSRAALTFARSNTAQTSAYRANLRALQSAVSASRAQLVNVQAQLANTILSSPIDGYVTGRYVDPGSVAGPGTPVLAIQSVSRLFVNVPLPEESSRHLHPGDVATIQFDALPGQSFHGRVLDINPAADPLSRQFAMRVVMENLSGVVKPGMFGRVSLVTEKFLHQVVVPREAVQHGRDGKITVVVVDDQLVAHRRPVETGAEDPKVVAITQGVLPGEKVVVLSQNPVKDGQKVQSGGGGQKGGRGSGAPGRAGRGPGA